MDKINLSVPKTFTDRVSGKFAYFLVLAAMVAVAAVGYTFLPDAEVSAQERDSKTNVEAEATEVATQAMIDFALNLHSASEFTVSRNAGSPTAAPRSPRGQRQRSPLGSGAPLHEGARELDRRDAAIAVCGIEEQRPDREKLQPGGLLPELG